MTDAEKARWLECYRPMRTARRLDELEASLASRGEAPFHLSGAGHEGVAVAAAHLLPVDWLHPHYRSRALILARGIPPVSYLHSLFGTDAADAKGRRMPPFVCDPALHLLSMPTLVGNNALQAVGVAAAVRGREGRPVVLCGCGDGGTQEGEFMEAVAEADRAVLPVLFVVEDNHYALSTATTGRTFYSRRDGGEPGDFCGVPVIRVDGSDVPALDRVFGETVARMREDRGPRIVVCDLERLADHSNSDDQTVYRARDEITRVRADRDPLARLVAHLLRHGVSADEIAQVDAGIEATLEAALAEARAAPAPAPGPVKRPLPEALRSEGAGPVAPDAGEPGAPRLTLLEALRETLRKRLADEPLASLCGQDIADPKGDVFGLTRGLSTAFPGRVRNAPLSESTIVGEAIGRALAGERPVACIQFADFLPVAYNQLAAELGTIFWRTAGAWEAPVVVLSITGGYRPGLGPFHAQSPEAAMVQIPGVDVFMPSNAADAAGLLQAAFESGRPSVFLYPKNLLNERAVSAPASAVGVAAPVGVARLARAGDALTFVGWGDTVGLCERAAEALASVDVRAEVLDLRTLSPWDRDAVLASAGRTGRLVVVHEDRLTCGLGAEIAAVAAERLDGRVRVARVAAEDTYLPFHFESHLAALPSFRRVLETAARMLGLAVSWHRPPEPEPGVVVVKAIGSSPSDENVRVAAWHAAEGQEVAEGALLASVEAEKAASDIASPTTGVLENLLVAEGDEVAVGTPIARLRVPLERWRPPPPEELEEQPELERPAAPVAREPAAPAARTEAAAHVTLSTICSVLGSRVMDNDEFLHRFPEWNSADVLQRTGIERRYWIDEGEDVLTLAVKACRNLLERERLALADIDVIICSTGTPLSMTPSLACRILRQLSPSKGEVMVQAYDLNAACSGYLYALQSAHDYLASCPRARIMVVTAETLSPVLDHRDPGTLFLFGDAATASLVSREPGRDGVPVRVHRPHLSAKGEAPEVLSVPFPGSGAYVRMEGQQVFRVAVRKMVGMLEQACAAAGVEVDDLAMIVPHQANTRIIESIRQKIRVPPERMFNHIRTHGNTSSNTIPLALEQVLPKRKPGERVGLCAFGGGFTFGAAILDVL